MEMKHMWKKAVDLGPGIVLAMLIAFAAKFLEAALPVHLVGASVIALFIGMIINIFAHPKSLTPGLKFASKKVLKFAIILLGASLSIETIVQVGRISLFVMIFTLATCFGGGYLVGKLLGLNWKLSNLISAGTGICGGSAIAAIAPVIEAKDSDIAYAMSATFLFDMIMIVLFPIIGASLGLSDIAYGLWAGTAVNDTSSVVAAGYAFSEAAGDFATMVKLTRTLAIIPTVLIFAYIQNRLQRQGKPNILADHAQPLPEEPKKHGIHFGAFIPWFIIGFIFLAILNSLGFIPTPVAQGTKNLSRFFMITALAAIGMNTNLQEIKNSGIAPMIHGFVISALVVVAAIAAEYWMGIV